MRVIAQNGVKIGERFGILTVIDNAEPLITEKGYKHERFLCKCDKRLLRKDHLPLIKQKALSVLPQEDEIE